MTYPPYLREKARQLRQEKDLTIDEIAERLAVSRTTAYLWVHDMPRPKRVKARQSPNQRRGNLAMQAKFRRLREQAYDLGYWEFPRMCREPMFRDFVCLYIAEGYKRNRNRASVANSDPAAISLALHWFRLCSNAKLRFSIQYHADQRLDDLREFWARELLIPDMRIQFQRKSNSNQLKGRTWRSRSGVLTIYLHDTLFRSRLQGWIDRMREQWLDSLRLGA